MATYPKVSRCGTDLRGRKRATIQLLSRLGIYEMTSNKQVSANSMKTATLRADETSDQKSFQEVVLLGSLFCHGCAALKPWRQVSAAFLNRICRLETQKVMILHIGRYGISTFHKSLHSLCGVRLSVLAGTIFLRIFLRWEPIHLALKNLLWSFPYLGAQNREYCHLVYRRPRTIRNCYPFSIHIAYGDFCQSEHQQSIKHSAYTCSVFTSCRTCKTVLVKQSAFSGSIAPRCLLVVMIKVLGW